MRFILFISVIVVIYIMAKIIIRNLLSQKGNNPGVRGGMNRNRGREKYKNIEDANYVEIDSKKKKDKE